MFWLIIVFIFFPLSFVNSSDIYSFLGFYRIINFRRLGLEYYTGLRNSKNCKESKYFWFFTICLFIERHFRKLLVGNNTKEEWEHGTHHNFKRSRPTLCFSQAHWNPKARGMILEKVSCRSDAFELKIFFNYEGSWR